MGNETMTEAPKTPTPATPENASPMFSGVATGCTDCLKVLDLFSGIGGFSLGLERAGMRTIAFCEIEKFPQEILRKHWPKVPIFNDVRTLHASDLPETPDVICGGYPCQPFSVAGNRKGKGDDRHLWPEIVRLIQELDAAGRKPTWCIFENVAGHISMGLDQVLSDLEAEGYTCWPLVIPACALNAPHRRDRVWIIANSGLQRQEERQEQTVGINQLCTERTTTNTKHDGSYQTERHEAKRGSNRENHRVLERDGGDAADPSGTGLEKRVFPPEPNKKGHTAGGDHAENAPDTKSEQAGGIFQPWFSPHPESGGDWRGKTEEWTTEPPVCEGDDGVPGRVARLKALGNAVIPQIPELIGRAITECR